MLAVVLVARSSSPSLNKMTRERRILSEIRCRRCFRLYNVHRATLQYQHASTRSHSWCEFLENFAHSSSTKKNAQFREPHLSPLSSSEPPPASFASSWRICSSMSFRDRLPILYV